MPPLNFLCLPGPGPAAPQLIPSHISPRNHGGCDCQDPCLKNRGATPSNDNGRRFRWLAVADLKVEAEVGRRYQWQCSFLSPSGLIYLVSNSSRPTTDAGRGRDTSTPLCASICSLTKASRVREWRRHLRRSLDCRGISAWTTN